MPNQQTETVGLLTDTEKAIKETKENLKEGEKLADEIMGGDSSPHAHHLLNRYCRRLLDAYYAINVEYIQRRQQLKADRVMLVELAMQSGVKKTPAEDQAKEQTQEQESYCERLKLNFEYLLKYIESWQEILQIVRITVAKTDVSPRADLSY